MNATYKMDLIMKRIVAAEKKGEDTKELWEEWMKWWNYWMGR